MCSTPFHHQAAGRRNRSGPVDGLRVRPAVGRQRADRQHADLGTSVCLYLPRYRGALLEQPEQATPRQRPNAPAGRRVLVVDDEDNIRTLVCEVLEEMGHRTLQVANGVTALDLLARTDPIDLLITDIGLPGGMNGHQFAERARLQLPDLKVLMITGYAEEALIAAQPSTQAEDLLGKPFTLDVLQERVQTCWSPPPRNRTPSARSLLRNALRLPAGKLTADALLIQLADTGLGNLGDHGDLLGNRPLVDMAFGNRRLKEVTQLFGIQLLAFPSTTSAKGRSPQRSSGTPTTATSRTASWRLISPSNVSDDNHSPPVLITS